MQNKEQRLLSCREAAKYLGITELALRKRIFLRQMKGMIRLGSRIYFDKKKLDAFVDTLEIENGDT